LVILVLIPIALFLFIVIKNELNYKFLIKQFDRFNIITFGKKGTGKDLFFQSIIHKRKKPYYSNISYGYNQLKEISVGDISVSPNTFDNSLENNFIKVPAVFKEKVDFFISDGGIYLPSQYDSSIDKKYPSMFIFYVLIRHLYNSNIHINYNGSITRLYKKLREQADGYIKMRRSIKLFGFMIMLGTYYDKYESAEQSLLPLKVAMLNKYSKADGLLYQAQNGSIKDFFLIIRIKNIKYNTRYFKDKLLQPTDNTSL
jgi:hypothetical protein